MASFNILFKASAEKELRKIQKPFLSQVLSKVTELADTPRPFGVKLIRGEDRFYRLRQGDYRIIYEIDESANAVTVIKIGHRREVYDR